MPGRNSNPLISWWKKVIFENYANFNGRARRAEYWYFTLSNFIFLLVLYIFSIAGAIIGSMTFFYAGLIIYTLYGLVCLIPALAVGVRRLHDINKSGWNMLIGLIPLVGSIILIVWAFTDGDRFTNQYGDDPKNSAGATSDFEQVSE